MGWGGVMGMRQEWGVGWGWGSYRAGVGCGVQRGGVWGGVAGG